MNELLNKRDKNKTCSKIIQEGSEITDELAIINIFNNDFTSIPQRIAESLPHNVTNFSTFLVGNYNSS